MYVLTCVCLSESPDPLSLDETIESRHINASVAKENVAKSQSPSRIDDSSLLETLTELDQDTVV
jgi:hypothetical protein